MVNYKIWNFVCKHIIRKWIQRNFDLNANCEKTEHCILLLHQFLREMHAVRVWVMGIPTNRLSH